jgi:hypothetical protein
MMWTLVDNVDICRRLHLSTRPLSNLFVYKCLQTIVQFFMARKMQLCTCSIFVVPVIVPVVYKKSTTKESKERSTTSHTTTIAITYCKKTLKPFVRQAEPELTVFHRLQAWGGGLRVNCPMDETRLAADSNTTLNGGTP